MTSPVGGFEGLGAIGSAYISFRARTDKVDDDLRKGLDAVAKDADKITEKSGKKLGQSLADDIEQGTKDGIKKPGFARRITDTVTGVFRRRKMKVNVDVDVDVDRGGIGGVTRRLVGSLARAGASAGSKFGNAFANAATSSFQLVGDAVASIGSSIGNVSSKGPLGILTGGLIILGIPALVAAIASLIAVLYPLVNVLLLVPAALAVIPAVIIPVVAAFWGMSDAVAAILSEDPEKIAAALDKVSKSAGKVAFEIAHKVIPGLKNLQKTMQEAFFKPFVKESVFDRLIAAMKEVPSGGFGGTISKEMEKAAKAAGKFVSKILLLVENPSVKRFMRDLFGSAGRILDSLTPGINDLIIGLSDLGIVSLPKIESGAQRISEILSGWGKWLTEISTVGGGEKFNTFMDKLKEAWTALKELAASGWNLVTAIIGSAEEEGRARTFFDALIASINRLTEFFESDVGKTAMAGLIGLAMVFLFLLEGIIVSWTFIGFLLATAKINMLLFVDAVKRVFDWVTRVVNKFEWLQTLVELLSPAWNFFGLSTERRMQGMAGGGLVTSPTVTMLGEGSKPEVVIPLTDKARAMELAQVSGLAAMLNKGQNEGNGGGTTIIFGPDSVRVDFHGAVPSEQEAYQTGAAVATGISDQLAKRNMRLAVRTLRS